MTQPPRSATGSSGNAFVLLYCSEDAHEGKAKRPRRRLSDHEEAIGPAQGMPAQGMTQSKR
jgi:hypothetical protein